MPLRWYVAGCPNVGKTSLVNALAGSRLKVGNWPGTTTEVASARTLVGRLEVELLDLPGSYTLAGSAHDEQLLLPAINADPGALVIVVVDPANLSRDLTLALELTELDRPIVVALNRSERATGPGSDVDASALEARLGVPVVNVTAHRRTGVAGLADAVARAGIPSPLVRYPSDLESEVDRLRPHVASRWHALAALTGELTDVPGAAKPVQGDYDRRFLTVNEARQRMAESLARAASKPNVHLPGPTDKIDRVLLHPWIGPFAVLIGLAVTFHLTFALSTPWVDFLGVVQGVATSWVEALPLPPLLGSFLSGAVIQGVGTVVAFVPVLFTLHLLLGWIENAGLLARVAYLADGSMRLIGLPGRAALPLVLSLGCSVPAVQATRTLDEPADRLRVALAIPSVPCGARLTVLVLLTAAFVPRYAAPTLTILYLLGFLVSVASAFAFRRAFASEEVSAAMELPPYRRPPARLVTSLAWVRTRAFLVSAGGPILFVVTLVWALMTLSLPDGPSVFEAVARALSPAFAVIGLNDWRIVGALIPGTVAKEVIIGSLALTFGGAEATSAYGLLEGVQRIGAGLAAALRDTATGWWSPGPSGSAPDAALSGQLASALSVPSAFSLMVFSLLYVPCVATLATIAKTFGRRFALLSAAWQVGVAYLLAGLAFRVLS